MNTKLYQNYKIKNITFDDSVKIISIEMYIQDDEKHLISDIVLDNKQKLIYLAKKLINSYIINIDLLELSKSVDTQTKYYLKSIVYMYNLKKNMPIFAEKDLYYENNICIGSDIIEVKLDKYNQLYILKKSKKNKLIQENTTICDKINDKKNINFSIQKVDYLEKKLSIILESNKKLNNDENLKFFLKKRKNFIKYELDKISQEKNITLIFNIEKNFKELEGIYDINLSLDNLKLFIDNYSIIFKPIYILGEENKILTIRPYITKNKSISFELNKYNNIQLSFDKFKKKLNRIDLYLKYNIDILRDYDIEIKKIFIYGNEQMYELDYIHTDYEKTFFISINKGLLNCLSNGIYHFYIELVQFNGTVSLNNKIMFLNDYKNLDVSIATFNNKNYKNMYIRSIDGFMSLSIEDDIKIYLKNISKKNKKFILSIELCSYNYSEKEIKDILINICDYDIKVNYSIINSKKLDNKKNILLIEIYIDIEDILLIEENIVYNLFVKVVFLNENNILYLLKCYDKHIIDKNNTFISNYIKVKNNNISIYIDSKNKYINLEKRKLKHKEKLLYRCNYLLSKIFYEFISLFSSKFDIWLVGENLGNIACDNGYAFFKYCIDNSVKEKVYYVAKKDNKHMQKLLSYKHKIVEYDSVKHKILYSLSKYLIVSHGIRDVLPTEEHKLIKYNEKDVIYLQHGIIAMKKLFFNKNSYNGKIKKFIVSSEYEKSILIKKMNFKENQILVSGLSRYDYLKKSESETKSKRNIIFMPTWREWLTTSESGIIQSDFYIEYNKFFTSKDLKKLLIRNNIQITFILHINMSKFRHLFEIWQYSDVIKIMNIVEVDIGNVINTYDLLVTDYSSIAFDFVYLYKPVIYFQPDKNEYLIHRGSFIDFEKDLPGDFCYNYNDLMNYLQNYCDSELLFKEEYKEISKKYYKYRDRNNSQRIYECISNLKD